ncbi:uncharacterized protein JCM6883_006178 [Sporobolomyces salmoneus]|uniref:uncharacterized protein n=1 Tax=Sporobolomyces salmoneus TaxID=183962 RepID=UPI00316DC95A
MASTQRVKKPKLSLDKVYGPQPSLEGKYATSTSFVRMYRAYQWTRGFDVRVGNDHPLSSTTLCCATHQECRFSITALCHVFDDPKKDQGPIFGKQGFRISGSFPSDPQPFAPDHSHNAPYEPMNVAEENARRANLSPMDASLENPPLVRVREAKGFASEATPMPEDTSMSSVSYNGGGGGAWSGGDRRSSNGPERIKREAGDDFPGPPVSRRRVGDSSPPPPGYVSAAPPLSSSSHQRPPPSSAYYNPSSPATTLAPTPVSVSNHTPTPAPSTSSSSSIDASLAATPLGSFLLEIAESFRKILPNLDAADIPLSTNPQELIDLDVDDKAIWELFQQVEGCGIALCALASEGVRAARKKSEKEPGQKLRPKIIAGLRESKVRAWTKRVIARGEQQLAQGGNSMNF